MNRVVITGLGCLTSAGNTPEALWQNALAGLSGIQPMPIQHPGLRFTRTGDIRNFNPEDHLPSPTLLLTERAAQLAILTARQAEAHAGLRTHHAPSRIAIFTGCSTAGRQAEEPETAKLYRDNARIHPLTVVRSMASSGASQVAIDLGITGPALNLSTACASGAHAIGQAFHMIRAGSVDAALAGGHEAPLTFGFLRAWDSMRVVSPTQCRPFSQDRDGMTLAEGAACLALESLASAQARNAPIFAEIIGFGMSTDAHHITQPKPEGPAAAIAACLADIQDPTHRLITYINAHGTATQANDQVETQAILMALPNQTPFVSSTKSLHGHAIGASPAIEALITTLALHHRILPHTTGLQTPDPTLNLNFLLNAPHSILDTPITALSNSLAFGGLNAVLALRTFIP